MPKSRVLYIANHRQDIIGPINGTSRFRWMEVCRSVETIDEESGEPRFREVTRTYYEPTLASISRFNSVVLAGDPEFLKAVVRSE